MRVQRLTSGEGTAHTAHGLPGQVGSKPQWPRTAVAGLAGAPLLLGLLLAAAPAVLGWL